MNATGDLSLLTSAATPMIEAIVVEQCAVGFRVGLAFAFNGVFGDEFRIELAGAVFEQFVKRGADGGFVFDAEPDKFGERIVIGGNDLALASASASAWREACAKKLPASIIRGAAGRGTLP